MLIYAEVLIWAAGGFVGGLLGLALGSRSWSLQRGAEPLGVPLDNALDIPLEVPATDAVAEDEGPETSGAETPRVPWWKAASTHQEPAAPGTEAFQEEASSLAEAIDTVAHTVRAIADRRLPVGGQSDWTPARGRLSEVDGLRLAYRLTLAWHRFQAGCTNEPLENVVRLNMIARLTKARSRDDHRARSNRSRSGPHRTPYEAAVHDLEVAKWDIATCLKHLEAGLERPFWELYRNLAFRTPDELFDLEGTDPAILQRVFRPLNQAAEGTPAQTVEEPVLSVATVNP